MHAQIITYELNGISESEYIQRMAEPDAPVIASVAGLNSKVWLANQATNTFGGFYLWESTEDMQRFMQSDLVAAVVSRAYIKNVHSVDFKISTEQSKITRGL